MEQRTFARRFGRVMMGTDFERIHAAMRIVSEMPEDSSILDAPCGGGIAMLNLGVAQRVSYVGLDLSPAMLKRAQRRSPRDRSAHITLIQASIERMPFADGAFDLCICFNGLHCVPDPAAAVREIARCLRPGGRLVGEFATRGQLRRADAYMALLRAVGAFGPAGTREQAAGWFTEAGLQVDTLERSGSIAHFDVRRPC
jgi:ubiquinone/menaquinone biosynthesis C-methylase UbiE